MAGAADVAAALAEGVQAGIRLFHHFSDGAHRQDALVFYAAVEDEVLPELLLQPGGVHSGAHVLNGVEYVYAALYQLGNERQDRSVRMVQHLLAVAVDQVAPVLQPALEEGLPRFQRDEHGVLHPHVVADEYDVAIVVGWELMKTVDSKLGGDFLGRAAYYEKEGKGIELPFPKLFGRLADETLKKYPELDEKRYMDALAKISVINYSNAKRNPIAQTRKWFMSYDQASTRGTDTNPLVGGKLGVSDCSQVTDGAAVVVLCSERFLTERGYQDKPVIKGYGHRTAPMLFDKKMADNEGSEYILPWTRQACLDAFKRAGLTVDDIDVFETHDCFTSSEYAAISAFGLTNPGHEYEAVESGLISFDGNKPINPSGGLIGCGHPVGASGARMFLDLYKQVTGTAGGYQVEGVKNGMMLNIGGSATTNYVFIVGKE